MSSGQKPDGFSFAALLKLWLKLALPLGGSLIDGYNDFSDVSVEFKFFSVMLPICYNKLSSTAFNTGPM